MLISLKVFHKVLIFENLKEVKVKVKYIYIFLFFFFFLFSYIPSVQALQNISDLEEINALSAVAIDGNTGKILFAKNPHLKIPPASTTKLVTAMVVLDHLPLDKKVKISKNAANTPSGSPRLYKGEVYTVKDLLYLMLMKSSNQAAVALAEAVAGSEDNFTVLMNQKIRSLGFKESHFSSASGLPAPDQYTTSYELALILYEALKYPLIKEIINTPVKVITSKRGRTLVIKNTNHLLEDPKLKNEIIGGKTGFTRASKHCLVNAARIKNRLIITSILGAPKRDFLWKNTKKLINFSELVLAGKTTPVFINTVVNTEILASKNIKEFAFPKRRYYRHKYRRHRHYRHRYYRHRRHYSKHRRYYYKRHRHYYKKRRYYSKYKKYKHKKRHYKRRYSKHRRHYYKHRRHYYKKRYSKHRHKTYKKKSKTLPLAKKYTKKESS